MSLKSLSQNPIDIVLFIFGMNFICFVRLGYINLIEQIHVPIFPFFILSLYFLFSIAVGIFFGANFLLDNRHLLKTTILAIGLLGSFFLSKFFLINLALYLNNWWFSVILILNLGLLLFLMTFAVTHIFVFLVQNYLIKNYFFVGLVFFSSGLIFGLFAILIMLPDYFQTLLMLNIVLVLSNILFLTKGFNELIPLSCSAAIVIISSGVNLQSFDFDPLADLKIQLSESKILQTTYINTHSDYYALLKFILYNNLGLNNKNILLLEYPDFTLSQDDKYNNHFTYILNHAVSACHFLDVMTAGDRLLRHTKQLNDKDKYDVVITGNQNLDDATLLWITHILNPQGIAIFKTEYLNKKIHAYLPRCLNIPLIYSKHPNQTVYICKKG